MEDNQPLVFDSMFLYERIFWAELITTGPH